MTLQQQSNSIVASYDAMLKSCDSASPLHEKRIVSTMTLDDNKVTTATTTMGGSMLRVLWVASARARQLPLAFDELWSMLAAWQLHAASATSSNNIVNAELLSLFNNIDTTAAVGALFDQTFIDQ